MDERIFLRSEIRIPLYIEKSVYSHKCPVPFPLGKWYRNAAIGRKRTPAQAFPFLTMVIHLYIYGRFIFMSDKNVPQPNGSTPLATAEKSPDAKRQAREKDSPGTLVRWLCVCGMLVALEIVLNRFLSINNAGWKIGFSFVSPMLAAMLYGPGTSALVWGLADFLGAILFPIGPYHPGFTICCALMGGLYGIFMHRTPFHIGLGGGNLTLSLTLRWGKIKFYNILIPVLVNCLALGLVVNTYWVSTLYGSKTYWGWFLYRLPEYLFAIPVQVVLATILVKLTALLQKLGLAGKKTGKA